MFQLGISWTELSMRPIHFHGAVMAMFASLIAPFGGFFASGFKRAFKLKVSHYLSNNLHDFADFVEIYLTKIRFAI